MKKIALLLLLGSAVWATTVTFKGQEVELNSKGLTVGSRAPEFMAVNKNFVEISVGGVKDKIQIIAFIPSFDTGVCKLETSMFNEKVSKLKNVEVTVVSKDLPFSIDRFCHDNKITNVNTVSDYKDAHNVLRYGVTISAPVFLEGFFARVIYVVDTKGKITYKEVVNEINEEPNYDKVFEEINRLNKE